jgi:tol-pal system protein YbgF
MRRQIRIVPPAVASSLLRAAAFARSRGVALALLLAVSSGAAAALFDDEEARKRVEQTNLRLAQVQKQLEDRIAALEGQMKSQGLVDLFNQVEVIKADIARMRGQIEVLNHELAEAQKRQRDLYVDLDTRVRKLEGAAQPAAGGGAPVAASTPGVAPPASGAAAPGAMPPPSAAAPPAGSLPGTAPQAVAAAPAAAGAASPAPAAVAPPVARPADAEQRAYDAALEHFRKGNYPAATAGFQSFVKTWPKSPLAPSAQYWVGNAQFAQKDYRGAIASQRALIAQYPDSQKIPDALLNIGSSQFELGEAGASRRTLEELIAKYPQSEAATKARGRLGQR